MGVSIESGLARSSPRSVLDHLILSSFFWPCLPLADQLYFVLFHSHCWLWWPHWFIIAVQHFLQPRSSQIWNAIQHKTTRTTAGLRAWAECECWIGMEILYSTCEGGWDGGAVMSPTCRPRAMLLYRRTVLVTAVYYPPYQCGKTLGSRYCTRQFPQSRSGGTSRSPDAGLDGTERLYIR